MENDFLKRISLNTNVCFGKPTIRNMRYPIVNILEQINSEMTNEENLADYEDLAGEYFQACLL